MILMKYLKKLSKFSNDILVFDISNCFQKSISLNFYDSIELVNTFSKLEGSKKVNTFSLMNTTSKLNMSGGIENEFRSGRDREMRFCGYNPIGAIGSDRTRQDREKRTRFWSTDAIVGNYSGSLN